MRTIKFRGKDIKTGEWVHGDLHVLCDRPHIHTEPTSYPFAGKRSFIDPATIGEFTGLTDKNGKEIYEGDIIRSTRNGFGGVVKWHKCGYFYICEDIFEDEPDYNGDYANLGYMLENHPYFEVVGNISDNAPERLKGGEQ